MTTSERSEKLSWPDLSVDRQAWELAKLALNGRESESSYTHELIKRAQAIKEDIVAGVLNVEVL